MGTMGEGMVVDCGEVVETRERKKKRKEKERKKRGENVCTRLLCARWPAFTHAANISVEMQRDSK